MSTTPHDEISNSQLFFMAMKRGFWILFQSFILVVIFYGILQFDKEHAAKKIRAVSNGGVVLFRLYEHDSSEKARQYLLSQGVVFREFVFEGRPLPLIGAPSCPACFPVILVDGFRIDGFRPKAIRAALDAQKSSNPLRMVYVDGLALIEQFGF